MIVKKLKLREIYSKTDTEDMEVRELKKIINGQEIIILR